MYYETWTPDQVRGDKRRNKVFSIVTQSVDPGSRIIQVKSSINGSMGKQPAVYILASKRNGTLYTGITSDLIKRVWQHKHNLVEGFTKQYKVHLLVWYELHETMYSAIQREKRIKEWKRKWKLQLIENINPNWDDLYSKII